MASCLAGCTATPPNTTEPEAPTATPTAPAIPRAQLNRWLDDAEQAIQRDHLTYPTAGSAFELYSHILSLKADQPDAMRGLEHIVERFVQKSLQALDQRSFAAARSHLQRARLVAPEHASIEPTARQIRLIMEADRETLTLTQPDLRAERKETVEALRHLGNYAAGKNCRFIIAAKTDGQGRWLYQQLTGGVSGERLRASMVIRLPASVERLCFARDA